METPYHPPTSHQSILAYDQKDSPRTLSEVFVSVYTGRCRGAQMRFGSAKGYHRIQDSLSDIFALLLNCGRQNDGTRCKETVIANSRIICTLHGDESVARMLHTKR